MPESYPCGLPLPLVSQNSFAPQNLVKNNEVQSGPPRFRLQSESGWTQFNVGWSFDALQTQVFENWFYAVLARGSKAFNIKLQTAGGILEHECYFFGVPQYTQSGRRFAVSSTLLAIRRAGLSECDSESLVNMYNGFESPNKAITQLNGVIVELEALWLP